MPIRRRGRTAPPQWDRPVRAARRLPAITYTCQNTTMAQLAEGMHRVAGGYVGHPAVDLTGLKGAYDFAITWTSKGALSSSKRAENLQPDTASDPSGGTTFFEAVEKQLGLHLEGGQKHPMMVLVGCPSDFYTVWGRLLACAPTSVGAAFPLQTNRWIEIRRRLKPAPQC